MASSIEIGQPLALRGNIRETGLSFQFYLQFGQTVEILVRFVPPPRREISRIPRQIGEIPVYSRQTRGTSSLPEQTGKTPVSSVLLPRRIGEIPIRSVAHAYIRHFNSNCMHRVLGGILMSNYLLNGATEAINRLKLGENTFILQVIYNQKSGGDTQLFITGTVEQYEEKNSSVAAISEIMEEARSSPIDQSDVKFISSIITQQSKVDWFGCPISKMKHIGCIQQRKTVNSTKKNKVSCIIHGSETEMITFLRSFPSSPEKGNDNISGLVAMHVSEIRKIIGAISNKRNNKFEKFMWYLK